MKDKCSRWKECKSYKEIGCSGCGFKHFDKIQTNNNHALRFLSDKYFKDCSEKRKGNGGRVAIDCSFKQFLKSDVYKIIKDFPDIKEVTNANLKEKVSIDGVTIDCHIKCDGAFIFNNKYFFYLLIFKKTRSSGPGQSTKAMPV